MLYSLQKKVGERYRKARFVKTSRDAGTASTYVAIEGRRARTGSSNEKRFNI